MAVQESFSSPSDSFGGRWVMSGVSCVVFSCSSVFGLLLFSTAFFFRNLLGNRCQVVIYVNTTARDDIRKLHGGVILSHQPPTKLCFFTAAVDGCRVHERSDDVSCYT